MFPVRCEEVRNEAKTTTQEIVGLHGRLLPAVMAGEGLARHGGAADRCRGSVRISSHRESSKASQERNHSGRLPAFRRCR